MRPPNYCEVKPQDLKPNEIYTGYEYYNEQGRHSTVLCEIKTDENCVPLMWGERPIEEEVIVYHKRLSYQEEDEWYEKVIDMSVKMPCLISAEGDINSPRLPSYKVKQTVTDDMVKFISFNDFEDQNADHYGLSGSATQVERIFPPEKNTEKTTISGNAQEMTEGLFELVKSRTLI